MVRLLLPLALALVLTGCGGQSISPTPLLPNPAAGVYFTNPYYEQRVGVIVLSDGRFYAPIFNGPWAPTGLVFGQGTASSGVFTGNYHYTGSLNLHSGTIAATYLPGTSFGGTLSEDPARTGVYGTVPPTETYDPSATPSLQAVSYHWLAEQAGGCNLSMTISASTGVLQTSSIDKACVCVPTGTVAPSTSGNFYDIRLEFPPTGCPIAGTASGIALFHRYGIPPSLYHFTVVVTSGDAGTVIVGGTDPNNCCRPVP